MRYLDSSPAYSDTLDSLVSATKSLLDVSKVAALFCAVSALWGLVLYLALQAA